MNKVKVKQILRDYFLQKGKALSYEEYRTAEDAPIRPNLVKRTLGGWNRVLATVGPITVETPEPKKEPVKEPIKEPVGNKKDDQKPTAK